MQLFSWEHRPQIEGNPAAAYSARFLLAALIAGILLSVAPSPAIAQGGVVVTPTRVVLGPDQRATVVTIFNRSSNEVTYRLDFTNQMMKPDGTLTPVSTGQQSPVLEHGLASTADANSASFFADPYIVYSPRQITLAPGASQAIRLLIRKPSDLPHGEYRSHLHVQSLPSPTKERLPWTEQAQAQQVGLRIEPLLGMSIPVIFRHGQTDYASDLEAHDVIRLDDETLAVTATLQRSGDMSLFGDISVHRRGSDGNLTEVGRLNGIAVYTSIAERDLIIPLKTPPEDGLSAEDLVITFEEVSTPGVQTISAAVTTR